MSNTDSNPARVRIENVLTGHPVIVKVTPHDGEPQAMLLEHLGSATTFILPRGASLEVFEVELTGRMQ